MRAPKKQATDEMHAEYDFSGGVRGKYAARFAKGTNVVVLAPDVAQAFKTSQAVNTALRAQMKKKPAKKAPSNRTLQQTKARKSSARG